MAHRSNQAVASQDRPPSHADPQPPPRRLLVGWATALAALALSTLVLGLGIWLTRFAIAEFFIGAALAERGAEADFRVARFDLGGATLRDVRFGSEANPDASIAQVDIAWGWSGLAPRLRALRLYEPQLRLTLDASGRLSAGSLDRLGGGPGRRRPAIPAMTFEIVRGTAVIEAPFGAWPGTIAAGGALGRDFAGAVRFPEATLAEGDYALERGAAAVELRSRNGRVEAQLAVTADGMLWDGAQFDALQLDASAATPLDLSRYATRAEWRLGAFASRAFGLESASGSGAWNARSEPRSLTPAIWSGASRLEAGRMRLNRSVLRQAELSVLSVGEGGRGGASWRLAGNRFDGLAMVSSSPLAEGALRFDLDGEERMRGDARFVLRDARLNDAAQADLRAAFPNLRGTPVGPTLTSAERALDIAADRYDLTGALVVFADADTFGVRAERPLLARAASGAVLQLAPADVLDLRWPGPVLNGAMAVGLSGGGAPQVSLLLHRSHWAQGQPFAGNGVLRIDRWRAGAASIAAERMVVNLAIGAGGGRIGLRGPAAISGPVGGGALRDLVGELDLVAGWDRNGWRVSPASCLPMRLGGLDVAGISFSRGAFTVCPREGVLVGMDARKRLLGGFSIERPALGGRLAGGARRPAQLVADGITGRFSGRSGDVRLAMRAEAPRLRVNLAPDRQLALTLGRATAEARFGDSWRLEGAFERGALADPALPGAISAIAGNWSARPEDGAATLRIAAGEALLTADPPATSAERPLFNPLRLSGVQAQLRRGRLEAEGALLLADSGDQLAGFTAFHDLDAGSGVAQIAAERIVFGAALQPYDITERARGLVENVRGDASLLADISWSEAGIARVGRLTLHGVSMATSTIPIVENVRGAIHFDDLFALTTPPGQELEVGLVNPGIAVRDGRVRFQLLEGRQVAIEQARFAFAGGVLAMSPTTIAFGADETRFELTMHEVEAADLLAALRVPDLSVTGRIEGSFPITLTRRTAFIENGVLRALPGGGTIAYSGDAGAGATGAARVAFDALRSFRYDALEIHLSGDLSDEVVSSIQFSGENAGRPVDLGPIAPGLGNVSVRGVPFRFNVQVTAPFRRLAQTAASIADPGSVLERSRNQGREPAEVDPDASPPR